MKDIRLAWETGRAAWPDVALDEDVFAKHVASVVSDREAPDAIAWADLYLACACAHGVAGAVGAFERAFFGEVAHARSRRRDLSMTLDDLLQVVRERLFVAAPATAPRIAMYSGRGDLRAWTRVVVTRIISNLARTPSPEIPVEDDAMTFLLGASDDPELAHVKARSRAAFEQAFRDGVATLEPRDRNLLRLAFIDDLSIDGIAGIYGIHRATAARWIAKARDDLAERVRAALKANLEVSTEECESMLRFIQSQIDITLKRFLLP